MIRNLIRISVTVAALAAAPIPGTAQHHDKNIELHINTRWSECAFQLDPALTQTAWRRFTEEAGLVAYFRPLADARPLGAGNFEVSVLRGATAIDDADPAWNDTFVHPHETHWLMDGDRLPIPGVLVRAGLSDRIDVAGYFTQNPASNYGFYGGQLQHNILNDTEGGWAVSGRASFVSLFGPDDLDFTVFGIDFLGSWTHDVNEWLTVSPYAGVSSNMSHAHEKSAAVHLKDEYVPGSQSMVGVTAEVLRARLALEVNSAKVRTWSLKAGVAF